MNHKGKEVNEIQYTAISRGQILAQEHSHGHASNMSNMISAIEGKGLDIITINATLTTVEGLYRLKTIIEHMLPSLPDPQQKEWKRRMRDDPFDNEYIER